MLAQSIQDLYAKRALHPPAKFMDLMLPEDHPAVIAWLASFEGKLYKKKKEQFIVSVLCPGRPSIVVSN